MMEASRALDRRPFALPLSAPQSAPRPRALAMTVRARAVVTPLAGNRSGSSALVGRRARAVSGRGNARAVTLHRTPDSRVGVARGLAARAMATKSTEYGDAATAVNEGLRLFESREYEAATRAFTAALGLRPNEDEARAASYNRACGYVKLNMYDEARDDLISAVNEHNLKFKVLMEDPDLDAFRSSTQYGEVAAAVKGGQGRSTMVNLRAEAQEPFRFFKLYLFGGLAAGAGLGLFIIGTRLIKAMQGGEGAPDMQETVTNLGINTAGLILFAFLLRGELQGRDQIIKKVEREEELGRLSVLLGDSDKSAMFSRLRGSYRVFIVAGSEEHITKTLSSLEKYKEKLSKNKVIVLPVSMEESDSEEDLPFGQRSRRAKTSKTTEMTAAAAATLLGSDKKLKLTPVDVGAWQRWIVNQVETSGFDPTVRDVFFGVAKNGTIWKSGAGIPNWAKIFEDLPDEDSLQGKVSGV